MKKRHYTKREMAKIFRRSWKATLGPYNNAKHYDPHGTKKPVAYAEIVRRFVWNGSLPEEALDWIIPASFGGTFKETCRRRED